MNTEVNTAIAVAERTDPPISPVSPEYALIDSLPCASLLAFTGASLDAFLYLNHGHVFAGVMTGNAVLCGVGVFNKSSGGALHYAWPMFAYVCGIWLIAVVQRHIRHNPVRFALAIIMAGLVIMSLVPSSLPDETYAFLVVLLTGFLVGISQKVDSYAYNVTVLTGTLRDGTISLYRAFDPRLRAENLRKGRDLWTLMLSFFTGAVVVVSSDGTSGTTRFGFPLVFWRSSSSPYRAAEVIRQDLTRDRERQRYHSEVSNDPPSTCQNIEKASQLQNLLHICGRLCCKLQAWAERVRDVVLSSNDIRQVVGRAVH